MEFLYQIEPAPFMNFFSNYIPISCIVVLFSCHKRKTKKRIMS